jgi:hypothetical protein
MLRSSRGEHIAHMRSLKSGIPSLEVNTADTTEARRLGFAIRKSVSHLPCQWFFTWLSGCPLPGELPRFQRSPLLHTLDTVGGFVIAVVLGAWLLASGSFWLVAGLLPPIMLLAVGRARKSYITIEHQVVHCQLFRLKSRPLRQWCNRVVGEFIGLVLWVPEPDLYHETHAESHHKNSDVATPRDRDGAPFFRLGFLPGMAERAYWELLWWTLADPRFYLRQTGERLWLSLVNSSRRRVILSWILAATLLAPLFVISGWWAFLTVYLISIFVGFPIAGLLQMSGRHFWGCHMDKLGTCARTALVCQGRFLLDPYPPPGAPLGAHLWFWARLLGYHLPARITVLNGDVQHHDWHHRYPGSPFWNESGHARMRDIENGSPGWDHLAPYTHTWSLGESIARTFQEMSAAPPFSDEWLAQVRGAGAIEVP